MQVCGKNATIMHYRASDSPTNFSLSMNVGGKERQGRNYKTEEPLNKLLRGCHSKGVDILLLPLGEGQEKRGAKLDGAMLKPSPQPSPKGRGSQDKLKSVGHVC